MSRASSSRKLWAAKLEGKSTTASQRTSPTASKRLGERFEGIVLGIDPSLRGTGLAVMEVRGNMWILLHSRTLKQKPSISLPQCLGAIHRNVAELITQYSPIHVAMEQMIFVQNSRTALIMGAARGAAISAAALANLDVSEYPPTRIKQAVSGFGRAGKEQVAAQVQAILGLSQALPSDESDAAAACICHCLTFRKTD